jgi:hypothetical protein
LRAKAHWGWRSWTICRTWTPSWSRSGEGANRRAFDRREGSTPSGQSDWD